MKRTELIEKIAEETNLQKKDVDAVIKSFTENVTEIMANGDSLQLIGFGTFMTSNRSAREGKNPKTGRSFFCPMVNSTSLASRAEG